MNSNRLPDWIRYSLIFIIVVILGGVSEIPDLALPLPQDSGWNPLIGLAHAIMVGAAFSLILVIASYGPRQINAEQRQFSGQRALLVFLIFAAADFLVELSARPLISLLSDHVGTERDIAQLVQTGGGWFVPLVFLTLFAVVFLIRRGRRRGR